MNTNVLVINLKKDTERLINMTKQLNNFVRIDAIDGAKDDRSNVTRFCKAVCTNSMIGCMKSHMLCWKYIVDNNLDYAIILEDDVKLNKNFEEESKKVISSAGPSALIDWDVILLGCFLCQFEKNDTLTKTIMKLRSPFSSQKDLNEYLYIPSTWGGMHAYVVSRNGAKRLLEKFPRASYHVDFVMVMDKDLQILASKKQLAQQNTSGKGSYNADSVPFMNIFKLDHGTMDIDFAMTMPMMQIVGYKISIWSIFKLIVWIIMFYAFYSVFKIKK